MTAFARHFRQVPHDVAVVIPTVLRSSLTRAVHSVFDQDLAGRIQILIGVDRPAGPRDQIDDLQESCPDNMTLNVVDPGYSTARRNGGIHAGAQGGSLRTALSFLANSRLIAYLDDTNWFAPSHLSSLMAAIDGNDWAFSLRWMIDPRTEGAICVDDWESVGPHAGAYARRHGGHVDGNSLMIDKLACPEVLPLWAESQGSRGDDEERLVFAALMQSHRGTGTGQATTFYTIDPNDRRHRMRLRHFHAQGYDWDAPPLPRLPETTRGDIRPPRARAIARLLDQARDWAEAGALDRATDLVSRILTLVPMDRDTLAYMGELCDLLGNPDDAATIAELVAELDRQSAEVIPFAITGLSRTG